jgi:hypothetical protein
MLSFVHDTATSYTDSQHIASAAGLQGINKALVFSTTGIAVRNHKPSKDDKV